MQLGRSEMKHLTATRIISPPASDDIPTGEREPRGHDAREKDTRFRRRKKQNRTFFLLTQANLLVHVLRLTSLVICTGASYPLTRIWLKQERLFLSPRYMNEHLTHHRFRWHHEKRC